MHVKPALARITAAARARLWRKGLMVMEQGSFGMTSIVLKEEVARRFMLGVQGLWPERRWVGRDGTVDTIRGLGRC